VSEHQASREDFELEKAYMPLVGKTLEEVIGEGETDDDKKQEKVYVTLNNEPQWLLSVMVNLKRKHQNVPNVSAVERLVAKLGVVVIRERFGEPIMEVERLRKQVFELINQFFLKKTYREGSGYQPEETVGTTYRRCSLREWTTGAINDNLVDPLGLSSSTAVSLTLIAGISKSQTWIPRGWVQLADKELAHFQDYLEEEVTRLRKRIHG